jgi:hypothetical protein
MTEASQRLSMADARAVARPSEVDDGERRQQRVKGQGAGQKRFDGPRSIGEHHI